MSEFGRSAPRDASALLRAAYRRAAPRHAVCGVVLLTIAMLGMPGGCRRASLTAGQRTVVIGMDGMDPVLCERLMDAGRLPNLSQLRAAGGYARLGTTMPPQSPVAWASFITSANPGVHGIFDFIHRDPAGQYSLYMGQARTVGGDAGWEVGDHRLPLTMWPFNHEAEHTELRRDGVPFWDHLDAAGIPAQLYDIPANYPPSPSHHGHMCCLAGMGVPDLLGSYGTYQYFSEDTWFPKSESGGERTPLTFVGQHAQTKLKGPMNTALQSPQHTTATLDIYRHPTAASARIDVQDRSILLREGEWSQWIPVTFSLAMPSFLPDAAVSGTCRFFLKQVGTAAAGDEERAAFQLYVTPLNINPAEPGGQRVTEPPEMVEELAKSLGLFATLGFQEDHKALSNGIFSDKQYHDQAEFVLEERMALLDHALAEYEDGLLFFYISSTDLQAHMFWWDGDAPHPVRSASAARRYMSVIEMLYERMDQLIGRLLEHFGDDVTLMLMSDHGFANFQRQFHLNTWLRQEGYIQPATCRSLAGPEVDWSRTTAYGVGLNGLYLNLQGRERDGCVDPQNRDALLQEISDKLLAVRDPDNGAPVVARVYRAQDIYRGAHTTSAPDLLVGYHRGYRASWGTTLGEMADDATVTDNSSAWSADHCIAAEQVPGVIFSNRKILRRDPAIIDVAPTILETFGLARAVGMEGRSLFRASSPPTTATQDATQATGTH